jgi:hypothetical protein
MRRSLITFVFALGVSYGSGVATSGCYLSDCDCPHTPERPSPNGPLPKLEVHSYDSRTNLAPITVAPTQGTLEVLGDSVAIAYEQDGVRHDVVYDVVAPL